MHQHKNFVFRRVEILESLGYVRKERSKTRGKARGIILLRTALGVPFDKSNCEIAILGYIAAGEPIPLPGSDAEPLGFVKMPRSLIPDAKNIYALKVQGNSMVDACIKHGDVIFIKYQEGADNGDLVAARLHTDPTNPTTTLKRLKYIGKQVWLKPENPDYESFPVEPSQIQIQGIVVHVWRNTRAN